MSVKRVPLYIKTEAMDNPSCDGGRDIAKNLRQELKRDGIINKFDPEFRYHTTVPHFDGNNHKAVRIQVEVGSPGPIRFFSVFLTPYLKEAIQPCFEDYSLLEPEITFGSSASIDNDFIPGSGFSPMSMLGPTYFSDLGSLEKWLKAPIDINDKTLSFEDVIAKGKIIYILPSKL